MVDVARLGLAVDSSQVEKGTATLHQLTGAAGQASAAAQRLAGATNVEAAGHKAAAAAAQAHNAALMAQNTVIRSSMQQRTMMIYQLNDVAVSLASGMNPAMVAMQQGSQILQGGFAPALRTITDLVGGLVTKFWPLGAAVGAVMAVFAGLTYEINKNAETQVSMIDVALAAWGMFADQVAAIVGPVWGWLVDGLQWVWDQMAPILKDMGNGIIRPFAFGVEAIGVLWQKLPAAIGDAMITTANVIIKGIEWSINGATRLLNGFLGKYNEGLAAMGQKPIPLATGITIPQAENPFQGALGQLGQGLEGANLNANSTDFMSDMFGGLSERAQQIALVRAETEGLAGATAAANDNAKTLANDGLAKVGEFGKSVLSTLSSGFADMFKGLLRGTTSVTDALGQLLGKLGDLFIDQAFKMLFGGLGGGFGGGKGGLLGGMIIPGILHSGGLAGVDGYGHGSAFSAATWAGAERYHSGGIAGLGPDEVPAILQRGERVIPANQNAANSNQVINVTYRIDAKGAEIGVEQKIMAAIKQNNRQLPNLMQDIQMRQG